MEGYSDMIDTGELNLTSKIESQWTTSEVDESKHIGVGISLRNMAVRKCQKN